MASLFKRIFKDISNKAGALIGDNLSENMHSATVETVRGMDALKTKAASPVVNHAVQDTGKGFIFEYIETAKFNRDAAIKGFTARAFTTESLGDPKAAADILIKDGGKTVKEIQAKFTDRASQAVSYQAGSQNSHWGKYHGMDRLIRKEVNYNEQGSMLDEARKLAKNRAESKGLYSQHYKDVHEHLTDETHYKTVSSGGTTQDEVNRALDSVDCYAQSFEREQFFADMRVTSRNMAISSAIVSGISSGVLNCFSVLNDKKELDEAIEDVSKDVVKGAVRGGATGTISTAIRYKGMKSGIPILSDSTAATIMASGVIDGGTALYSFAKGEINGDELVQQLTDTTIKSVSTIYFTKAVEAAVGSANPFLPIALYTISSYVVTTTREIMKEADLNAKEYERMASIHIEFTKDLKMRHEQLLDSIANYREAQQRIMTGFLASFDYNMETGENYEHALYAIVHFANQTGIALQHTDFNDFKAAMQSDESFILSNNSW